MVEDKIFLDQILTDFPLRELDAATRLVENMRGIVADLKQRIVRLAVENAGDYGWALDKVERIDQILCAALYLDAFGQIPEAFIDHTQKKEVKSFGIGIRRFLLARRLPPEKIRPLAGIKDAAVFLLAVRPLLN
jgi:hypothetical protein